MKMKKCYTSHSEMAHVWVHTGTGGLYTPEHRTNTTETYFKSYRTAIAKRVNANVIIIDVSSYSNTTNKHQQSVLDASSHLMQLITYVDVNSDVEENIEYFLKNMEAQIKSLSRAWLHSYSYNSYHALKKRLQDWCAFGGVDVPSEVHQLDLNMDTVYKAFVQRRAEVESKREQKERERNAFIEAMRPRVEKMSADSVPLWRQHRAIDIDNYFDHAEQKRIEYFKVNIGHSSYYNFGRLKYNHIRLSKCGKYLETDGHATVPIREACVLCDRLDKGKDVIGLKLGHYTILEKNEEYLKIGCHKFQWSELEHLRAICANAS